MEGATPPQTREQQQRLQQEIQRKMAEYQKVWRI